MALASRKDARDAVVAARKAAVKGWAGATAYNRGQILYRVAEMLEGRARAEFVALGVPRRPRWTPRSTAGSGTRAGPTRSPRCTAAPTRSPGRTSTSPRPSRPAWSAWSPRTPALLGLVSVIAPAIVTGNTVVVVASPTAPLPAVTLAEVLATSDLPGGVVNILTGAIAEIAPLAGLAHGRQRARPDRGRPTPTWPPSWRRPPRRTSSGCSARRRPTTTGPPTRASTRMTALLETKTVWHPKGV